MKIETLLLTALASGCATDDLPPGPPRGPEDFAISQVSGATSGVAGPDGTLTLTCDEPLLVWIGPESAGKLGNFLLEPPGSCGDETNCGWMVLVASFDGGEPEIAITSAQTPIRLDLPPTLRDSRVQLHAELRDSEGATVMRVDDEPLFADLELAITRDCGTATE